MTSTNEFLWMIGEESSDPLVRFGGRLVRVDQMASTGHLDRMEQDLDDIRRLGVRLVRYGINWRRVQPQHGAYTWDLWDRAFAAFERLGLTMVVDLLHFGTPDWLDGVSDSRLPDAFLRYTEEFVARYPQAAWFTPVNEPYITAYFSTCTGIWNEGITDEQRFVDTLARLCLADLLAAEVIRSDRKATFLHSESIGHDVALDGESSSELAAQRSNAFRLLSFDFRYGVLPGEAIRDLTEKVDDTVRQRLDDLATTEDVIAGHDYYPVSVPKDGRSYSSMARALYARYRLPFMIAETSNLGLPPEMGPSWLSNLYDEGCELRREGYPFLGICWYSRGDQHDWLSTLTEPVGEVTPVGLFDIGRRPRPVAGTLRSLIGQLAPEVAHRPPVP